MLTDKTTASSLTEQFVSSPRGARLARRLAVRCMAEWGYPPPSDASCAVALVVGELAANAVRHGRAPGHDFGLRLVLDAAEGLVRVEVADAVGEKRPPVTGPSSCPEGESGRGLLLVDALAVRRGTEDRWPVGKTVWAEVPVGSVSGSGDRPSSAPRTASPAVPAAGCPG
ncbi:ATP-binding protein [Streptomyces antibioticus]|uniref:ATP-binding protein n=1 Tax=Streptomyces antibioticus TaxID=1890 RepID=UPI002257C51F|nr:ATP-binding protein [Streptomyces antibioticus]MCX4738484.1 ATP-binding protein [Streptomyces antibioticus]